MVFTSSFTDTDRVFTFFLFRNPPSAIGHRPNTSVSISVPWFDLHARNEFGYVIHAESRKCCLQGDSLLIGRRLISRFATFQFLLGDRHHGDVTRRVNILVLAPLSGQIAGYTIPRDLQDVCSSRDEL